jgi:phospholipid/cholesterol/gamma-HCH transport system ATP-binding protein
MSSELLVVGHELRCGYDVESVVLDGVDIRIERGEVVTILGGSGSGKSTLLKTLGGLLPPLAGTVELFGEDLYAVDDARRAELLQRTGTLFQHDALFGSMTLRGNVALPIEQLTDLPDEIAERLADTKLDLVELAHLAERFPSQVSGGQRKRAALARAVVLDPEIVWCDEPTSGLDPITAARLDHSLLHLRDVFGLTIVAVTHDVESVRTIADRAIVVGCGAILAEGTVTELEQSELPGVAEFFHRVELERSSWQPEHRT